MKKIIALLLALTMVFALVACGEKTPSDPVDTPDVGEQLDNQEVQQQQQEGPKQDETYIKDELNVAWDTATTLVPWGTKNSTPGNYLVYEMLYAIHAPQHYPLHRASASS